MGWIAGADGCKNGWCIVLFDPVTEDFRSRVVPNFAALLGLVENPSILGVDIPIGLPEATPPGGRACDVAARGLLRGRASSVFSPPGRLALRGVSRAEADSFSRDAGGIGIGAQTWGLAEKLRETDAAMTPELQHRVHEIHPEVSFRAMNGATVMAFGKKSVEGAQERMERLAASGLPEAFVRAGHVGLRVGRDDFIDACAALWTARRIAAGSASRVPANIDRDARGLDQAIWF